jgi:selenocysteine-specific elongation factor
VSGFPSPPADGSDAALHVVATAGHIDHGKSTLIQRITGIDPDRLEEEKRRGLTIDLGFAWCSLPSGAEIGFVDVPGHERFVRTMLAGVGPVRLVLFVVAADEGWRTQSEEHLAIVDVLEVDGAVVAITKRDLVDAERAAAVEREVRDRLAGTALDGASIVACSATSGAGIDDLLAAIDAMVGAAPAPEVEDRPRQFVDRVFTIAGAGTVVTGTLTGGRLAVGDEVEALPSGARARIRGLQTHKRPIEIARPVSRVAVNLVGVGRAGIERGDVIARPRQWRATTTLEARIRPVRGLAHPVTARGAYTFHAGAAERAATLRVYRGSSVHDEGAFVRIRLSAPLVLDVHDRFVLRESGRRETVAGGVVLDAFPPRRPGADAPDRLARREHANRDELADLVLAERGAVREVDLRVLTGLPTPEAVRSAGDWNVTDHVRAAVRGTVLERLSAFHDASPAAEGMDAADLRAAAVGALREIGAPGEPDLADALIDELIRAGDVLRSGRTHRLPSHRGGVAAAEVDRIVAVVAGGEPRPPSIAELVDGGHSRDTVEAAVRSGALVRIAPDLVVTPAFVARTLDVVRGAGAAGATVSVIRQQLDTSRRYAVPLLEHLDRTGLTRRSGDLRFARGT